MATVKSYKHVKDHYYYNYYWVGCLPVLWWQHWDDTWDELDTPFGTKVHFLLLLENNQSFTIMQIIALSVNTIHML